MHEQDRPLQVVAAKTLQGAKQIVSSAQIAFSSQGETLPESQTESYHD